MDKLVFKGFTWPENPEVFQVSELREPEYELTDAGVYTFTGLGQVQRVITGSGCFTGPSAYTNFKALAKLLEDGQAGKLIHPVWDEMTVFFLELTLIQEPRLNYVAYRFKFREADSEGGIPR